MWLTLHATKFAVLVGFSRLEAEVTLGDCLACLGLGWAFSRLSVSARLSSLPRRVLFLVVVLAAGLVIEAEALDAAFLGAALVGDTFFVLP